MTRVCKTCNKEYKLSEEGAGYKYCSQDCADEARRIRNRERWREANPGWDDGTNKVCEWCGKEFTVPARNAHIARFCSDECRYRSKGHKPMEEYLKELEQQKEETQKRRSKERAERRSRNLAIKAEREERAIKIRESLYSERTCVVCGKPYKTIKASQITCSAKCAKRWQRRKKDKRINENNLVDSDITLAALYKRDKGICYICNKPCNYEDHTIESKIFIAGPTYPSIEHLVPLSCGGKHSWGNIKLAHCYCNAIKNDAIYTVTHNQKNPVAHIKRPRHSIGAKPVKQIDEQGTVVAIYKSTAEAERKTGIKQRGIQACARGEQNTCNGYVWEY